jgi:signal transduction histidine kinase
MSAGFWVFLLVINLLIVFVINALLEGLIKNSRIPFNLDHLFELGTFSLVGMLAIGLVFMSYFIIITSFIRMVYRTKMSFYIFTLLTFAVYGIFGAIQVGFSDFNLIDTFWTLPLILAIGSWIWYSEYVFYFGVTLLNIAIFAFFTAYVFERYNIEKEHEIRKIIGERINQIQDPILELNLDDKISRLQDNEWMENIFLDSMIKQDQINDLVIFFGEEWFRFKKRITLSNPDKIPLPGSPVIPDLPIDSLTKTASDHLFFYYSQQIGLGYLFSVPILSGVDTLGYLSGVFSEIPAPANKGFPKLLDNASQTFINSNEYLYARYRENTRFFSNAEDEFPVDLSQLQWVEESHGFVNTNNLNILVMPEKYGYRWMIAKPIPGFLQHLTIFSYLFLFLGFLYTTWLIFDRFLTTPNPLKLSLRSKIQVILIGFILGILTIYAIVIYSQITEQFHQRNNEQITERLNSINIELQHKTGHLEDLGQMSTSQLKTYLDKFSEVFYSDISLFNNSGLLAGSSSSLIWEKNLLSRRVNPTAYSAIELDRKSRFIHQESIGTFQYLSGYKPLYNDAGQRLGILNVPYFTRQDNLKNEVNRFLLILINVFVLLTGISVIVAIYVSNWITSPLKLLQTSFSSLDLINVNKPIDYRGTDEVATMVNVYNKKVKELQEMADQIAQSERESAWREMARQVAHEIKNPLTPMRLSIQHFQRLISENPEEAMKKSKTLVNSLIEQIDNLTQIANEFSQFAKISVSARSEFDLKKQLIDTANLFSNDENIKIKLEIDLEEASIQADKGQIIRMFNNLIKNAIQAIGIKPNGEIIIRLSDNNEEEKSESYRIEIEDNGKGIPKELQSRIFNPNFTTKSTGMGLGLAIINKIVSNHKGSITFITEQDKGTVFIVVLPKDYS